MDALREIIGVVCALAVVLGLAFVALKTMKRFQIGVGPGRAAAEEELRFLRALPVGQHERLVAVAWRGETLLLGVTAGGITVIDRKPATPAPGIGENPS